MGDTAYPAANALKRAKNLSDVADAATALSNLGGASSASVVEINDVADGEVYQRSGAAVAGVSLGALATGADAGDVPYTPTTGGDWADPDPDDAAEALDDLASRLTAHEAATVDITDVSDGDVYTRSGAGVAGTTLGDLATGTINDLTAQGTPTGGTDYVAIWDAGLGAHRKVLLNDLPGGGGGGGGLNDVVDDTTPQLGGDLDVNGNSIVSVSNGDVDIAPNGTGRLTVQSDIYTTGDIVLEGATANDFETTITVTDPTADRTITAPDATGTIVTTGNSDVGATTTDTADVDHVLVNDGGVLKKITPADLGITNTLATVVAYYAGAGDATDTALPGSTTTAIVYDTETTDTGGDYNNSTGVFTAPADGIYYYAASLNHSGNTVIRPVIQIDTGGGYSDFRHGTDADQQPDGNTGVVTGVVSLSSGDLVRFAGQNKTATQGRLRGTAFNTQNVTHMSIQQLR